MHPPLQLAPWDRKEWDINPNVPKPIAEKPFNNKPSDYKNWADRIKDHAELANARWKGLLDFAQAKSTSASSSLTRACHVLRFVGVTLGRVLS